MSNEQQASKLSLKGLSADDLGAQLRGQVHLIPWYRIPGGPGLIIDGVDELVRRINDAHDRERTLRVVVVEQGERIDQLGESLQRARDEAGKLRDSCRYQGKRIEGLQDVVRQLKVDLTTARDEAILAHNALQRERYAQSAHDRESNAEEVRRLRRAHVIQGALLEQVRVDLARALKDASDKQARIDELGKAYQEAQRQAQGLRQENEHKNLQLQDARTAIAARTEREGRLRAALAAKDDQIAAFGTIQNKLKATLATQEQAISQLQELLRGRTATVEVFCSDPRVAELESQLKHCHQRLDRQRETIAAYQRSYLQPVRVSSPKEPARYAEQVQVPRDWPSAMRWLAEEEGAWE